MTAMGMTFGFGDALALAENVMTFADFTATSAIHATRGPAFLAMGLYEVFADHRAEAVALPAHNLPAAPAPYHRVSGPDRATARL